MKVKELSPRYATYLHSTLPELDPLVYDYNGSIKTYKSGQSYFFKGSRKGSHIGDSQSREVWKVRRVPQ